MTPRKRVWFCLLGNTLTLIVVTIMVCVFRDPESTYFRFGPQPDLILISVRVDNWTVWSAILLFIALLQGCDVLVNELGSPVIGFRVYNPDCTNITDFSRFELNFLANGMWFINGFKKVLMAVVTITQVDLALAGMFVSEIVGIFTVYYLLKQKTFSGPLNTFSGPEQKNFEQLKEII